MKNMKDELERAFVLCSRPFCETSLIVDLFTQNFGRISVVAKGAKRSKNKFNCLMQPFLPLLVSWQGSGSLYTLTKAEQEKVACLFFGKKLLSGMYLNELIYKLLPVGDPYPIIFNSYYDTLKQLEINKQLAIPLRYFEKNLLKQLGYELQFNNINSDLYYDFIIDKGPVLANNLKESENSMGVYKGSVLLALDNNCISTRIDILETKRLMRQVIKYYLDGKKMAIKEFF